MKPLRAFIRILPNRYELSFLSFRTITTPIAAERMKINFGRTEKTDLNNLNFNDPKVKCLGTFISGANRIGGGQEPRSSSPWMHPKFVVYFPPVASVCTLSSLGNFKIPDYPVHSELICFLSRWRGSMMNTLQSPIIWQVPVFMFSLFCVVPVATSEIPLIIHARARIAPAPAQKKTEILQSKQIWSPAQTMIIVCDMWNLHWCQGATRRVAEMAPVLNQFVSLARDRGVLIVHAPSDCMAFYENYPARKNAREAPPAEVFPKSMEKWCKKIASENMSQYPLDQSDGGCDDQPSCPQRRAWTRQIESIVIHDNDVISDNGREIWNVMQQHQIKNVLLVGVHLNMCVLGRPFGLRNMKQAGKNVLLCRDLTDTMYNSRARPFVSHFEGTRRMVEYVEKYVCPTMVSTDLTRKQAFHFSEDNLPAAQ
jgi:nicotinamidase-related amidase